MSKNTFSKLCLKLFFRLLGLSVCCFITCAVCFSVNGSQLLRTFLQIVCIVVMVLFLYPVCFTAGDLDAPLVSSGHKKKSNLKGLYAGLLATSPMIVSGVVLLIAKTLGSFNSFVSYYKMINAVYFPLLYSILPVDYSINELPVSSILLSVSILFIIPIVCMFAYILGLNRFYFKEKLFYKKKASW